MTTCISAPRGSRLRIWGFGFCAADVAAKLFGGRQGVNALCHAALRGLLPALVLLGLGGQATANTLTQNVSWTIDRAGTSTKYRLVAYGDSIYAGYNGSVTNAKIPAETEKRIGFNADERKRLIDLDYGYLAKNDAALKEWWDKVFKA